MFEWMEATSLARAIQGSSLITGALSSLHLIGLALVAGGALFSNLAGFGAVGPRELRMDAIRPTARAMTIGLLISVSTGLLLFMPRAVMAAGNSTFRIKMSLLALAACLHFTVQRVQRGSPGEVGGAPRAARALGLALWLGVALAGCAFILLE
jgi:hypothetical protein